MVIFLHNSLYKIRYNRIGAFIGRVYETLTRAKEVMIKRYGVLFELNNRVPVESYIIQYIRTKSDKDIIILN